MTNRQTKIALVLFIILGLGAATLLAVSYAFAQEPVPVPVPAPLPILDRILAFLSGLMSAGQVASIGFIVGMVGRFIPAIKNKLVPALVLVANILMVASQVIGKFVEAASGVAWTGYTDTIQYAGFFGGLKGILLAPATVFVGLVISAIDRWVWEKIGKPVLKPDSPTLNGGGF